MKKFTALAMALVLALTAVFVATPNEKASAYAPDDWMSGNHYANTTHGTCPSCTRSGYTLTVTDSVSIRDGGDSTCWNILPSHRIEGKSCRIAHILYYHTIYQRCSSCGYSNNYSWTDEYTYHFYYDNGGITPDTGMTIRG